jgi:hypothetical protein
VEAVYAVEGVSLVAVFADDLLDRARALLVGSIRRSRTAQSMRASWQEGSGIGCSLGMGR